MLEYLVAMQRWSYSSLSGELSAFAATRDWLALATVLPVGIFFGAVQTPGHGKAILASYLVSSRLPTLRATVIATVQAATHVGSAVILALLAIPLVTRTLGGVGRAPSLEVLSRGLLMTIGLWLVIHIVRRASARAQGPEALIAPLSTKRICSRPARVGYGLT